MKYARHLIGPSFTASAALLNLKSAISPETELVINFSFQWEWVSFIVRIYLFIISFNIVYIFSKDKIISNSVDRYSFREFFWQRVAPLLLIYLLTIIFTFVDYSVSENFISKATVDLFNGRYSNIIIYSVMLWWILETDKRPRFAVPLFLFMSVIYFAFDKLYYNLVPQYIGTAEIKIAKFAIISFVLHWEFYRGKYSLKKIFRCSAVATVGISVTVFSIVYGIFYFSAKTSPAHLYSSDMLMGLGVDSVLDSYSQSILLNKDSNTYYKDILYYSEKYDYALSYSINQYSKIYNSVFNEDISFISTYLYSHGIVINKEFVIKSFGKRIDDKTSEDIVNISDSYIYIGSLFKHSEKELAKMSRSTWGFKNLWILDVVATLEKKKSVPILIDRLFSYNLRQTYYSYNLLSKILGVDPARELKLPKNSLEVLDIFKSKFSKMDRSVK